MTSNYHCAAERELQDQEVQVARENHRKPRPVQVRFVSNKADMHVSVGLGLGLASPDLDSKIQSILNVRN